MVNKIDIKPATLISGSTVSVQVLKYIDGALSENNTYTFDANDFESLASASNPYVAILTFGSVHTENINGSTTQCFFDGVVCSPNDAFTLAGLVEVDVTSYASGGGGYTFPSNSGNTAYVSSAGNDATGVVGNISKPFLTTNAAIDALNSGANGVVIVLSSTTTIEITNFNALTKPSVMHIEVLCNQIVEINGATSIGSMTINTQYDIYLNTTSFLSSGYIKFNCFALRIISTSTGTIAYTGSINCEDLIIQNNALITISADVLIWTRSASVGTVAGFTYNVCPPMVWDGRISQVDTAPPTVDAIFKNTYAETLTTDYINVGEYNFVSAGARFDPLKTRVTFGSSDFDGVMQYSTVMKGAGNAANLNIHSFDAFLTASDNMIQLLDIKIETYL